MDKDGGCPVIGALKGINTALASLAQPSSVQGILPVKRALTFFPVDEGASLPSVRPDEDSENEGLASIAGLRPENPLSSSSLASVFSVLEAESTAADRSSVPPAPEQDSRGETAKPALFERTDDTAQSALSAQEEAFRLPVNPVSGTAEVSAASAAEENAVRNGPAGLLNVSASVSVNAPLAVQAVSAGLMAARSYAFASRLA